MHAVYTEVHEYKVNNYHFLANEKCEPVHLWMGFSFNFYIQMFVMFLALFWPLVMHIANARSEKNKNIFDKDEIMSQNKETIL